MVTLKNSALRKISRFGIDHFEEKVTSQNRCVPNRSLRRMSHFEKGVISNRSLRRMSHFEKCVPLKSISSKWTIFEVIYFDLTHNLKWLSSKWPFSEMSHFSKWPILRSYWFYTHRFTEVNFFIQNNREVINWLEFLGSENESLIFTFDLGSTDTIIIFVENYFREHLAWAVFVTISPVLSQSVCLENRKHFRNESDIEMKLFRSNWIWNRFWTLEILDFLSVLCNNFGPDDKTFDLSEKWRICDLIETEFITNCEI